WSEGVVRKRDETDGAGKPRRFAPAPDDDAQAGRALAGCAALRQRDLGRDALWKYSRRNGDAQSRSDLGRRPIGAAAASARAFGGVARADAARTIRGSERMVHKSLQGGGVRSQHGLFSAGV